MRDSDDGWLCESVGVRSLMSLSTYTTPSGKSPLLQTLYTNLNIFFFGAQAFYYHRYTRLLLFSRQVANCSMKYATLKYLIQRTAKSYHAIDRH